ncbi:Golgi apparatus membrane protein TVP23 A [Cyanidiococcus yangmingshanensis]|uniref:Golgi apparatus membrane protein TVP23 homolog n=1 Tax=Cyanidiococcus yangmingshanensis TaxID=2690220 RepID=A0A7J7IL95_9RHOD|nr:Golgi apparatus membrane protein TVP23 A [Cyanidiococcus yangmingshanensis]
MSSVERELSNGSNSAIQAEIQKLPHFGVLVATVAFRISAIASFLLLGLFTSSFVVQTVVTLLLLALDFWTVKNISGRILVGLRWWNQVQPDGSNALLFEFRPETDVSNSVERNVFWWSLYLAPICWTLLGLICILKFELNWLFVVFIAFVLQTTQLSAYWQCARVASKGKSWSTADSLGAVTYMSRQFERLGAVFKRSSETNQESNRGGEP